VGKQNVTLYSLLKEDGPSYSKIAEVKP
jgi:hypothetical protein